MNAIIAWQSQSVPPLYYALETYELYYYWIMDLLIIYPLIDGFACPLLKGRHYDLFIFTFPDPRDTKFMIQVHDNSTVFWYFSISVLYGKNN